VKPTRLKARCVASQLKSQYQIADKYVGEPQSDATNIYIDNMACVDGISNDRIRSASRWQSIRLAFVRDQVRSLLVSLMHISGTYNPADIGTKALSPGDFDRHASVVLGLRELPGNAVATTRPL
jgi:hypothetical protein